jgi:hypothetical protein
MAGPSAGAREIKVKENKKPWYMDDVAWVPSLPPRHRWRKTFEVSWKVFPLSRRI